MGWEKKFISYGVLDVEGSRVRIFMDRFNSIEINVGSPVKMAIWNGDRLNVYLMNGKIRRYTDRFNYITI